MSIDELKKQVDKFFSDTARSPEETRDGLQEVSDHIAMLCDTLPDPE